MFLNFGFSLVVVIVLLVVLGFIVWGASRKMT